MLPITALIYTYVLHKGGMKKIQCTTIHLRIPMEMKTCFGNTVILLWVMAITFFPFACGKGCSEEQTRALLEIRNSTNGVVFAGWDGKDCCNLTIDSGIFSCDGISGGVSIIHLAYGNSDMAPSRTWYPNVTLFALFDELEQLHLPKMQIGGGLQPFCELKRLKHLGVLDLRGNGLEGVIPTCLGMIANLQELDLSDNWLHGNLPPSIFSKQSKVAVFRVWGNQLEGILSSSTFANASSLQDLNLSDNLFYGNLPPLIFSNQSRIQNFDVSDNQLEGVLSFSIFANASSLQSLDLSNNYDLEFENESPSWVPTFQLQFLSLQECNINKKNSHVVLSFIYTQLSLNMLVLSRNSIEGSIPCPLLLNTSIIYLFLRSNKFDGSFLDCVLNQTSSLEVLDMSDNHVKGRLPEYVGHLLPNLRQVNMSSNELEGNIPWSFGNLSLEILDLSNNRFSGTIPQSLTRDGSPMSYLNLSNNTLQGEMLPKSSNMTQLEILLLGGNHFEGVISPSISNSHFLKILDVQNNYLSGNIPRWLYGHPILAMVLLSGNRFEGHLLRLMCQMKRLRVFDISNNHVSGRIPSCLDNITFWKKTSPSPDFTSYFVTAALDFQFDIGASWRVKYMIYDFKGIPLWLITGIDMSSNQLTGSIPSKMGDLSQLQFLNLSNNFLTGPISNSFRNLKKVESLDLSHNNLSGKIPYELVELTSLSIFSVAYNNLSGRIPVERQFSTFGMQCYNGNLYLCGDPLPRNCSTTNELEPEHKDKEEGTRVIDTPLFFYAFVAVSYAFGFWVFFGILIINKNWRYKYFRAVDRFIESCFEILSKYW